MREASGEASGGYHLFNTLLHVVATAIYTITVGIAAKRTFVTFVAGLLFAIHPVHTEAVAGIVGRADVLCAIFFLLALLAFIKYWESHGNKWWWMLLTLVLVTASTLCKEIGITVLGVCAVYCVFSDKHLTLQDLNLKNTSKLKYLLQTLGLIGLFGVGLLAFRLYFMGYSPPSFSPADNPAADSDSALTRTLTFLYLPVFNLLLLICPITLSFDWSMDSIPLVESVLDHRVLLTLVVYSVLIWLVKYCLSYFCSSVCKQNLSEKDFVNNLGNGHLKLNGSSSRLLNGNSRGHVAQDGPQNGGCDEGITHRRVRRDSTSSAESSSYDENQNAHSIEDKPNLHRHHSTLLLSLSLLILPFLPATNLFFYVGFVVAERVLYVPSMGFCLLTAEVLYHVLYKSLQRDQCRRQCLYTMMVFLAVLLSVRCYVRCLDWRSEEELYRSGISVNPAKAWGNLANILNAQGDTAAAEKAYRSALSHRANMADVHYNLGILLQDQERYGEALEEYEMAIQCRPRLTVAHLNKGIVLAMQGNHAAALQAYNDCIQVDASGLKDPRMHETAKTSALYNRGRLYAEQGDYNSAILTYNQALQQRPEYYQPQSIYNLLGEAYFHTGDHEKAEKAYMQSLESKPDHLPAHLTLARLMNHKVNITSKNVVTI